MFKIVSLSLNGIDNYIFKDDYTLIYGPNNVGKSIMIYLLDYMLGSSGLLNNESIWKHEGLENVEYVEMIINNGKNLYLKRTPNELFYKFNESDNYLVVDEGEYKNIIQSSLTNNQEIFEEYYSYVNEKLNYRGFSYLNVIDQYALGNITNLFPESIDYRFIKRLRKQMNFLFDSKLLKKLNEITIEKKNVDKQVKKLEYYANLKNIYVSKINENMHFLNIKCPDEISEKKSAFKNYINNYSESTNKPINRDLSYLISISNQLSSQIEIERTFSKQSEQINTRNNKIILLMKLLQNSVSNSDEYSKYLENVEMILTQAKRDNDILSLKDYSGSLEKIITKKKKIDDEIISIKNTLKDKKSEEIQTSINLISYYFNELEKIADLSDYDELKKKQKELSESYQDILSNIGNSMSEKMNKFITTSYLNLDTRLSYVDADSKTNGFSIQYIPRKMAVVGKEKKIINDKEYYHDYMPGSKARQSCWQVITYLSLLLYINKNRPGLPILPIVLIDGFNEPFDENFELAYNGICSLFKDNNIQLIVSSTQNVGDQSHVIDLSRGLNSKHQ